MQHVCQTIAQKVVAGSRNARIHTEQHSELKQRDNAHQPFKEITMLKFCTLKHLRSMHHVMDIAYEVW